MNAREWALIVFTILTQLSVGMLITLLIVRTYLAGTASVQRAAQLTDLPLYAAALVMILALIASLFHLGKVLHVIGAVPNLATSWMSREVVFAVTFMILTAVVAFLVWRKIGSESLHMALGWIAAAVGVILLGSMSMTYMLPAEPAWNTLATPIMFFVTSLLMGAVGCAAAMLFNYTAPKGKQPDPLQDALEGIAVAAVILMGIELVVMPIYLAYLGTAGPAALQTLGLMVGPYGLALGIRLILVLVGAGLLAMYLYRNASVALKEKTLANVAYGAFVLVLLSEVLGRFLFYATRYRIGV